MTEPAHILVVDDDPGIRRVFQSMLSGSGYRVTVVGSGEEALAYLHLITPDLILLDLTLPGINGYEMTRRLKADTSKPFIPVIVITAHGDVETSVNSLDAGADDFIVKPVEMDELLARVRAMLRLQRAQRDLRNEQRKTELLLHLTRELGASIELDVLLTRFLDHLADAVGAVRASMILTDFDSDRALFYSSSRRPATTLLQEILRQGVAGQVLRDRAVIVIADTRDDDRWISNTSYSQNVRSVAAVPVLRENTVLGVITLVHHTPGYFSDQHVDLLESVATQTAVALESARLFSLTQRQTELLARRAEELRRLNEVNAYLSELMQPDQLVRLVVYIIQQQFGYPQVSLLMHHGGELVVHAAAGAAALPSTENLRLSIDSGLNGWAFRHQQLVRVDDVTIDDRFVALRPADATIRSELIVPIILRRRPLGTLDIQSPEPAAFGPNDEALMGAVVGQLSIALGNAFLLEEEQRRIQQLSQVNDLSVAITASLDPAEHLQLAIAAVTAIFNADAAALLLVDDEAPDAVRLTTHGLQAQQDAALQQSIDSQFSLAALIRRLRSPRVVQRLGRRQLLAPLANLLNDLAVCTLLLVPLRVGTRSLGVIALDLSQRDEAVGRADRELAATVASLIVQVLENARLYRAVEDERSTLHAVLRGAANPVLLVSPEHELLLANRAAEERLALQLGTDRRRTIAELAVERNSAPLHQFQALLDHDASDRSVGEVPTEVTLTDGTVFSISLAPVRSSEGQPIGQVAVWQDISAIKMLERQERDRVRGVFRRYVSPVVAERLLSAGQDIGRPTECDVAVLFGDLRGFTSLAEQLDPHVLVDQVLNRYFTAMTEAMYHYDGTIDKFLGDGIIGVFGSPIARPDDPQRALLTAVEMQRAFAAISAVWRSELGLDIGMGIGIGYGRAVVGNIGSDQRLDYTLIGDVVNTASRLSALARSNQIILSHHLYDRLPPTWQAPGELRPLGPVALKGKQEPHLVYEVLYEDQLVQIEH